MDATIRMPGVEVPPVSLRLDENLWGFDMSTRRLALGVVQGKGPDAAPEVGWFTLDVRQLGGGAPRLAGIHEDLPPFARRIAEVASPSAILVEQPFGQGKARPHPQSYYVVGVALALLAVEFPTAVVDVVEPSSWKCDALGAGAGFATKPQVLRWAREAAGYTGDCPKCHGHGTGKCDEPARAHDEADALGVVTSAAIRWTAARRIVR